MVISSVSGELIKVLLRFSQALLNGGDGDEEDRISDLKRKSLPSKNTEDTVV